MYWLSKKSICRMELHTNAFTFFIICFWNIRKNFVMNIRKPVNSGTGISLQCATGSNTESKLKYLMCCWWFTLCFSCWSFWNLPCRNNNHLGGHLVLSISLEFQILVCLETIFWEFQCTVHKYCVVPRSYLSLQEEHKVSQVHFSDKFCNMAFVKAI